MTPVFLQMNTVITGLEPMTKNALKDKGILRTSLVCFGKGLYWIAHFVYIQKRPDHYMHPFALEPCYASAN